MENFIVAKRIQATVKAKIKQAGKISFTTFCENISSANDKALWEDFKKFESGPFFTDRPKATIFCGQDSPSALSSYNSSTPSYRYLRPPFTFLQYLLTNCWLLSILKKSHPLD
ncbi:hypothetical protein WA026_021072 [Henosepilachna vigintioctopunctata]|uniref:Uncharacterized protein n=1 Tax=Henosepilachna vigintioctopunctata TaxID=420089 RepID=A0AAW1V2A3_9CUCU